MRMTDTNDPEQKAASSTIYFFLQVDAISALKKSQRAFQFDSNPSDGFTPGALTVRASYGDTVQFVPLTIQPGYTAFIRKISYQNGSGTDVFGGEVAPDEYLKATIWNPGEGTYSLQYMVVSPSGGASQAFTTTVKISA